MTVSRSRTSLALVSCFCLVACERMAAPAPADRAARLIRERGDRAREIWLSERSNWDVGLSDEVAGRSAGEPLRVVTIRDVRPSGGGRCTEPGSGPLVFRTGVVREGRFETLCAWADLDAATRGHRRLRAVVARAEGDREAIRAELARPPLESACRPVPPGCERVDLPL